MDIVLDILDELVLDRVYAAALPLSVFLPKAAANITASAVPQPAPSLWTSVISTLPHPPLAQAVDAAGKIATHTSALPTWLLRFASPAAAASAWPRDYVPRQLISLTLITLIGIHVLYFVFAALSYYLIFDHNMMKHPRFLKNQVKLEIECALRAFPAMTLLTLPWFLGEVRGYSRLYEDPAEYGYAYLVLSVPFFFVFTDYLVYWIHRLLHHPLLYKRLHKPHHKWLIPTPFASHAFHPVDGYAQSLPYHIFIFLFPLQRWVYLGSFVAVNFWSIFIHDSDMITGNTFVNIINGPAHHTLHHLYFTCNYGQYFTWADRWGGSYKHPSAEFDPMNDIKLVDAVAAKHKSD
ncbi:sterol desaturase, putative [Rhizoctonia solani AG-1 IB]|uniref:C-5 sterol desaturase n=1 Tax=Thanatephorus cucumeris (strain AG1-IB / isolate 7/3/14) TaxID=1108050 RepID=M5BYT3_THACB|nr:C-5 sterol desaturase [Rhizoctonia solani AG-1 IB]CEL55351.1 sterol desaturase, putative [Rhizoctonia solani AG-1 IB]